MSREWKAISLDKFVHFNPRESLKKGVVSKKITMDKLGEFERSIRAFELDSFKGGAKFRNDDTLVARITPCLENGKSAFVDILEGNEVAFGSTEFIVVRARPDVSDKLFNYYLFTSPGLRNIAIQSMVGSSGRQRVQLDVLANTELNLPPLPEQKAIAHVLGALDDKIELNRQINQTLEQMAQALFKSWFVDFDPVIDNALAAGNPIPEPLRVRAEKRKKLLEQSRRDACSPPVLGGVPRSAWQGGPSSPNQENPEYKETQVAPSPPNPTNFALNNLPHLKTFRKVLRNNMTPAEASLWRVLKGKQLAGRKFRRQHSVGNYILDFYCPSERLAVELDGQGHFEEEQLVYDRERDLFLEHFGVKVLRFENKWVYENTAGLIQAIQDAFGWKERFMEKNKNHPAFQAPLLQKEGNTTSLNNQPASAKIGASSPPNLGGVAEGRGGINSPNNNITPESSGVKNDFNHLFPSSFTYSETLGKWIPEGWEGAFLTDWLESVSKTYNLKKVEKIIFLNTGDIEDGKFLHADYSETIGLPGQAKKSIKRGDILYSEIRPKNKRYAYVDFNSEDYVVSTKLMVLRPKVNIDSIFFYQILKSDVVVNELQHQAESRSGTFPQITFDNLGVIPLVLPSEEIMDRYLVNLKGTFKKIKMNERQTRSLTQLRDILLPKLISGKLRLPEDFVERFEWEE